MPQNGIQTGPFGSQLHAEDYALTGTPIVTVEHLGDNRIIRSKLPRVKEADKNRLSKYTLLKGDIVFSRVGSVDRRAIINPEEEGWLFSGRCLRIRPDKTKIDPSYLSWFLGLSGFKSYIRKVAVGATMPSLNTSILKDIEIYFPSSIHEQRAIAYVLSSLDDKLEVNRRMNETLEAMARALFKSWFVDFDPVRAKMENRWRMGESLPGLPANVYELFPDRLVNSEMGMIPVGWEVKTIGDLAEVLGGSTPSTTEPNYWNNGVHHWVTPKDLSTLAVPALLETERRITEAGLEQISSGLLPVGTVLLSSRAPIGYLAIAEVPVAINQGFIAMKPRKDVSNLFLLLWAGSAQEAILSRANGSTFLEINRANYRPISVVAPPTTLHSEFDRLARPLYRKIVLNEREVRTLRALRNEMLPKLVSGEIRTQEMTRRDAHG
jgi:type I restriction enzyme, S subunit